MTLTPGGSTHGDTLPTMDLRRVAGEIYDRWPGLRDTKLGTTTVAFVVGLIMGSHRLAPDRRQDALLSLDSMVRLGATATGVERFLREQGFLGVHERGTRAGVPTEEKRARLRAAGWRRNDRTRSGPDGRVPIERWVHPTEDDKHATHPSEAMTVTLASAWKRYLRERGA